MRSRSFIAALAVLTAVTCAAVLLMAAQAHASTCMRDEYAARNARRQAS